MEVLRPQGNEVITEMTTAETCKDYTWGHNCSPSKGLKV